LSAQYRDQTPASQAEPTNGSAAGSSGPSGPYPAAAAAEIRPAAPPQPTGLPPITPIAPAAPTSPAVPAPSAGSAAQPTSAPAEGPAVPAAPVPPPVSASPAVSAPPAAPPASSVSAPPGEPTHPAVPPPPRRRWPAVVALVLALLLLPVAAVEGYLLYRLDQRLDATRAQAAADRSSEGARLDALERRASDLEQQVGSQFNPAAVAEAALPSVFRVRAGEATGTAFAVGREPTSGGTYLFTNSHVIEGVWDKGIREVFLERRDQRFPATIIKVDKTNDVALLQAKEKFPRLETTSERVRSGEQIAVVGSPLGLEDSVTTGVVSAYRKIPDFAGEVFQFDAAINPGNSGGPVINSKKQVVGIATAKAREAEGIGLAVPIATACAALAIC